MSFKTQSWSRNFLKNVKMWENLKTEKSSKFCKNFDSDSRSCFYFGPVGNPASFFRGSLHKKAIDILFKLNLLAKNGESYFCGKNLCLVPYQTLGMAIKNSANADVKFSWSSLI